MNKTSKTLLALLATGLLSCGLFSQNALATEGSILMNGLAKADHKSSDGTTTTITFSNPWFTTAFVDGDYAGVPTGTSVTFSNFSFANDDADGGGLQATLTAPVVPLWTFTSGGNTYSFDLLALTNAAVTTSGSGGVNYSIAMSGTGIAYINGVGSAATWSLNGSGRSFQFAFSSSATSASGVPDGGATVALLGIGLVGIATLRRKLKAAA